MGKTGLRRAAWAVAPVMLISLVASPGPAAKDDSTHCEIPAAQNEFVQVIMHSREEYYREHYVNRDFPSNLGAVILAERRDATGAIIPGGTIENWLAVLRRTEMTDSEEMSVVQASLEVGPHISFRLQFNRKVFGDTHDTRLPVESPLGSALLSWPDGAEIVIKGRLVEAEDGLLEIGLTTDEQMRDPAYLIELQEASRVESVLDCLGSWAPVTEQTAGDD